MDDNTKLVCHLSSLWWRHTVRKYRHNNSSTHMEFTYFSWSKTSLQDKHSWCGTEDKCNSHWQHTEGFMIDVWFCAGKYFWLLKHANVRIWINKAQECLRQFIDILRHWKIFLTKTLLALDTEKPSSRCEKHPAVQNSQWKSKNIFCVSCLHETKLQ